MNDNRMICDMLEEFRKTRSITLANFLQDFDLYMDPFYKEQK